MEDFNDYKGLLTKINPMDSSTQPNWEVISYYQLRQLIGLLGISLPIVLARN